jgi:hypothetical protein
MVGAVIEAGLITTFTLSSLTLTRSSLTVTSFVALDVVFLDEEQLQSITIKRKTADRCFFIFEYIDKDDGQRNDRVGSLN